MAILKLINKDAKDALEAEIERLDNYWHLSKNASGQAFVENLFSFLDTLEVKNMDLDFQTFAKEMETVFSVPSSKTKNTEEDPLNWEYEIAKHFFELGMAASYKAQKEE